MREMGPGAELVARVVRRWSFVSFGAVAAAREKGRRARRARRGERRRIVGGQCVVVVVVVVVVVRLQPVELTCAAAG